MKQKWHSKKIYFTASTQLNFPHICFDLDWNCCFLSEDTNLSERFRWKSFVSSTVSTYRCRFRKTNTLNYSITPSMPQMVNEPFGTSSPTLFLIPVFYWKKLFIHNNNMFQLVFFVAMFLRFELIFLLKHFATTNIIFRINMIAFQISDAHLCQLVFFFLFSEEIEKQSSVHWNITLKHTVIKFVLFGCCFFYGDAWYNNRNGIMLYADWGTYCVHAAYLYNNNFTKL